MCLEIQKNAKGHCDVLQSQEKGSLITQQEISELPTGSGQRTITHFSVSSTRPPEDEMLNVRKLIFRLQLM